MGDRFELMRGQRIDSLVLVDTQDNFIYHRNNTGYRCHLYALMNCFARVRLSDDGEYVQVGNHNHEGERMLIEEYKFINACKDRSENTSCSFRAVYNEVVQRFPNVNVPFPSIERSMLRARRMHQPSAPRTIDEIVAGMMLNDRYNFTRTGTQPFYRGRVQTETGSALLFVSQNIIPSLIECSEMHIDGTFWSAPNLFKQVVSIHAVKNNQMFVVGYGLLTNKRQDLYQIMLEKFTEIVTDVNGQRPNPAIIISDYEMAIMQAMQTIFPDARIRGCMFHYGQAVYRKACKLGLKTAFVTRPEVENIIRLCIALSLVPADKIEDAMQIVREETGDNLNEETEIVRTSVISLLNYVQHYWIGYVTPERFCVSNDTNRTNNAVEAFNRKFNVHIGKTKLNYYTFVDRLQAYEEAEANDYRLALAGERIRRNGRTRYLNRDVMIRDNASLLEQHRITLREFMHLSTIFFVPACNGEMIIQRRHGVRRQRITIPVLINPIRNVQARLENQLQRLRDQQHQDHDAVPLLPQAENGNAMMLPDQNVGALVQPGPAILPIQNQPIVLENINPPHNINQNERAGRGRGSIGPIRALPRRGRPRAARQQALPAQPPAPALNICTICLDRPVRKVMIPCGHTFCDVCAEEIDRCGLCREEIDNKFFIFL